MDPDDIRLASALEVRQRTGKFKGELNMIRQDRSIFPVEVSSTVFKDSKGNDRTSLIISDITDRKKAEDTLKQNEIHLNELNATKDKFFSIISHDLRSPFNSFLGLTQIMAEDLPSLTMSQIQEIAASMSKSATNLFRLLENLLQWSKIQQGGILFNPQIVQLSVVVQESIEIIQGSAKIKEIEIVNETPETTMINADINMLQTILRNLVSNAIKFTAKGGKVNIIANSTDHTIEISVSDSGIGMTQTVIDNLFKIDVKTSRKGTEGELGSGLGLLLCKEFIEKHEGEIRVESKVKKGSTFYFTLPI
jgi:signal transduction histidine kinase